MSEIEVGKKFKPPAKEKIDATIKYYKVHGKLDKPISVSCHGTKYKLEDGYLRYYVAKNLGLKSISAKISTERLNNIEKKLKTIGTRVIHEKFGQGIIWNVNGNKINVAFGDGKEVVFDVEVCVKNNFLSVI